MLNNLEYNNFAFAEALSSNAEILYFTICDQNNNCLYPAFKCKDFFQDFLYTQITKKTMEKYRFKTEVIKDDFKVVLCSEEFQLKDYYKNMIEYINLFPVKIGNWNFDEKNNALIIEPVEWTKAPYLMSLFLLLIRSSIYYNPETDNTVLDYIKRIGTGLNSFIHISDKNNLKNSDVLIKDTLNGVFHDDSFDNEKLIDEHGLTSFIHHHTGSVSFQSRLLQKKQ